MAPRHSDVIPGSASADEKAEPAQTRVRRAKRTKSGAKSGASVANVTEDERRAMIAEAAYFHAERRGFAPGNEDQDWLKAEAEVDALLKAGRRGRPQ